MTKTTLNLTIEILGGNSEIMNVRTPDNEDAKLIRELTGRIAALLPRPAQT
jgi:hypothetical protein